MLSRNLWQFIWHFLKPYTPIVILFVCMGLFAGCWGPFNSLLIKYIINSLTTGGILSTGIPLLVGTSITTLVILLVINFIVFDNLTWRSIDYIVYKYIPIIKNKVIRTTFSYILGSSYQFFHDILSGQISSQVIMLADNIELILRRNAVDFIRGLSLLVVALIAMYFANPMFFYTLAIWFAIFFSFSLIFSKNLVHLSDQYAESETLISGQLVDDIANVNNIRLFARNNYELCRLDGSLENRKRAFRKNEMFLIKMNWVQGLLIALMMAFMVYFLIQLHEKQMISIGDFALILGLGMEIGHMSWYTMSQVDQFNQAVGKCKQCLASLIVIQEIQDKKNSKDLSVANGKITFSNVEFYYKGTIGKSLFQNKSVTIEAGQKVGLVGYSGGGKSTFVNLILRLYEVNNGSIMIDDQDIKDVKLNSLYENIALIPQDPTLFHRSIEENIRYGRLDASDEAVIASSKKAHAHEFIIKLPQGYNSLVGERGVKLSGGQRQRIAIARAILKNAPILILDEATSQLDSVTEKHIQESLWELMQNKTTIIVAHRLSTLLHMDRILVFDNGKIVEDGSHNELLEKNGLYSKLWNTQVGGFLQDKIDLQDT